MTDHTSLPPHRGRPAQLAILTAPVATHDIESLALPSLGPALPAYRLFIARPRRVGPGPVLYMLDGNAAFDFLTPALLESVPDLAIVGVGYDTAQQFARAWRMGDYSPPEQLRGPMRVDPHAPERMAGGADLFLDRLIGPIRDLAESRLDVDPSRRTLWGHSFGGLCTLYAACTRPGLFSRYAIISPSLWWDTALADRFVALRQFDPAAPTPVYMGCGDREKRTGEDGPPPTAPSPLTVALVETLRADPGLRVDFEVYPGAIHIAALPASLPASLRLASP